MDAPRTLTLLNGNTARVLTAGSDSDGRLTVIDYSDFSRGNPPPFTRHDFIEVFTVLEGRLAFQYQDEGVLYLGSGEALTTPPGKAHTFWNPDPTPLRILLACSPAGLESFFQDIHAAGEDLKSGKLQPEDIPGTMDEVRKRYGIEQTAPAPGIELPG